MMETGPWWLTNFASEVPKLNDLLSIGLFPVNNLIDASWRSSNTAGYRSMMTRDLNPFVLNRVGSDEFLFSKNIKTTKKLTSSYKNRSDLLMQELNEEFDMLLTVDDSQFLRPIGHSDLLTHWQPIYSISTKEASSKLKKTITKFMFFAFDNMAEIPGNSSVSKMLIKTMNAITAEHLGLDLETLCDCVHLYRKLRSKLTFSSLEFDQLIANLSLILSAPPAKLQEQIDEILNKNKFALFEFGSENPRQTTITGHHDTFEPLKSFLREEIKVHNAILLNKLKIENPEMFYLELARSQIFYALSNDSPAKEAFEFLLKDNKIPYSKNVVDFPIVYDFVIKKGPHKLVIMVMDETKHFLNVPNVLLPKIKYDLAVMDAEKTNYILVYTSDLLNPVDLLNKISYH